MYKGDIFINKENFEKYKDEKLTDREFYFFGENLDHNNCFCFNNLDIETRNLKFGATGIMFDFKGSFKDDSVVYGRIVIPLDSDTVIDIIKDYTSRLNQVKTVLEATKNIKPEKEIDDVKKVCAGKDANKVKVGSEHTIVDRDVSVGGYKIRMDVVEIFQWQYHIGHNVKVIDYKEPSKNDYYGWVKVYCNDCKHKLNESVQTCFLK